MSTFVNAAHNDYVSTASMVINAPASLADNDLLLAILKYGDTATLNSPPSGWASRGTMANAGSGTTFHLYTKLAASEGASYTFGFDSAARMGGTIVAYRGAFDTGNPIDAVSNTSYVTADTTLRAAAATAAAANSSIIFIGGVHNSSVQTFTAPTVPTTFTKDVDNGSTDSRFSRIVANCVWSGSGSTGDADAGISVSTDAKHAFMVILNPSAGGGAAPDVSSLIATVTRRVGT